MKLGQLKQMIREELEMFARTAGTGGSVVLTPKGKSTFENIVRTRVVPDDLSMSHVAILKFLYNAEKEGKRVQKIDYANSIGKPQPAVNSQFNYLEINGYIKYEGYVSKGSPSGGSGKPKPQLDDLLGDIELDDNMNF